MRKPTKQESDIITKLEERLLGAKVEKIKAELSAGALMESEEKRRSGKGSDFPEVCGPYNRKIKMPKLSKKDLLKAANRRAERIQEILDGGYV